MVEAAKLHFMTAVQDHSFFGLHAAWWLVSIAAGLVLAYRPNPRLALLILIMMHGGAFAGYYNGLARPYGVGVGSDRSLGLGMVRAVADGGSPFEHVQVQFGNLEPFWTFTVAALSGFSSDRSPWVYDHMALLTLALTALGFYRGWSRPGDGEDRDIARWRGVLVAACVLGLSSMSLTGTTPTVPFWHANFVFKPNHSIAFGIVGLLAAYRPSRDSWARLAAWLGLLMWAFILDWAYLLPAFVVTALLEADRLSALRRVFLAAVASMVVGAPYVAHLLRDYNPVTQSEMPEIWRDPLGERFTQLFDWTLGLGLIFALFLAGLVIALRRRREEPQYVGFLMTAVFVAVGYLVGLQMGFAPEPDEGFFWVRMVAAAGCGYALSRLITASGRHSRFLTGAVFGAILLFSFPGTFDPATQDRYFTRSLQPLEEPILQTARWIRENTTVRDVILSGEGITLSGLTGRRFLMVRPGQTRDREERDWVERQILTSLDEKTVRSAASQYGVTHVVLDGLLARKHAGESLRGLGNRAWFSPEYANSFARILVLKKPGS
jgi:hypothetical protein